MEHMANKGLRTIDRAGQSLAKTTATSAVDVNDRIAYDRPADSRRAAVAPLSITVRLLHDEGILIVSLPAWPGARDFERLHNLIDPYIRDSSNLKGLLIELEAFPDWDELVSMLAHIRFRHNGESRIARLAAVSHRVPPGIMASLGDYFTAATLRHFAPAERAAAMNWLRGGRQVQ